MSKHMPADHKKLISQALRIQKSIEQEDIVMDKIQDKLKNDALRAVKDLKEIKYHLKVMKDIGSLFIGKD